MTGSLHILAVVVAYFLGAVPFGMVFARLFSGIDVRTIGSGNIGATNVLRASGKQAAVLTLLADALKGFLPVFLTRHFLHNDVTAVLAGTAAVLGHNYPVYLGFRGGKGIATGFGVMLAAFPWIGLVCLAVWLGAAALWRYSSLAALVAFAACPILTIGFEKAPSEYGTLSVFLFAMSYYRHRENIKRLLGGTEPKIGKK